MVMLSCRYPYISSNAQRKDSRDISQATYLAELVRKPVSYVLAGLGTPLIWIKQHEESLEDRPDGIYIAIRVAMFSEAGDEIPQRSRGYRSRISLRERSQPEDRSSLVLKQRGRCEAGRECIDGVCRILHLRCFEHVGRSYVHRGHMGNVIID